MQLRRQFLSGKTEESDEAVRAACIQLARDNPGSRSEVSAYLFVVEQWPESADAVLAHGELLRAAESVGIGDWAQSLHNIRPGSRGDSPKRWRPLVPMLIDKARRQPEHPQAARLLCETAVLIHPDTDVELAPPELHQIAELIRENHATSPDLANFCEVVGNLGNPVDWSRPFEPHVRHILEANEDRFVRCTAHFALATIVRAGGIERQAEACELYEEFLDHFDRATEYHAQGVEQSYRKTVQAALDSIRLRGLGLPGLATTGVDLNGREMSLADFRGKVVLISFWATWCAPCMDAIPHERSLLEQFGPERFAIVGVNLDKTPSKAIEAGQKHGIIWRSFQDTRRGGTSISSAWRVTGYPTFFLLDRERVIRGSWQGLPPKRELEAAIAELLESAAADEGSGP